MNTLTITPFVINTEAGSSLILPAPPMPTACLLITASDGAERVFELPTRAITIGKSEDNKLRLVDGAASRRTSRSSNRETAAW